MDFVRFARIQYAVFIHKKHIFGMSQVVLDPLINDDCAL